MIYTLGQHSCGEFGEHNTLVWPCVVNFLFGLRQSLVVYLGLSLCFLCSQGWFKNLLSFGFYQMLEHMNWANTLFF